MDAENKKGDLLKDLVMTKFDSGNEGEAGTAVERETADRTTQTPEETVRIKGVASLYTPLHLTGLERTILQGKLVVWGAFPRPKGHPTIIVGNGGGQITMITITSITSLALGGGTSRARLRRRASNSYETFVESTGNKVTLRDLIGETIMDAMDIEDKTMRGGFCHVALPSGPGTDRLRANRRDHQGPKRRENAVLNTGVKDTAMPPAPGRNSSRCWRGAVAVKATARHAAEERCRIGDDITLPLKPRKSLSSSGSGTDPFMWTTNTQGRSHRYSVARVAAVAPAQAKSSRP